MSVPGIHKVEIFYEIVPGITLAIKWVMLRPKRHRLASLLNAFDKLEVSVEGWTIMIRYADKFKRYFKVQVQMWFIAVIWAMVMGLIFNKLPFENKTLPFVDTTQTSLYDWKYWVTATQQYTFLFYGISSSMFMEGYPALIIALICGYLEAIAEKVKKIGWIKEQMASREELIKCIKMHQRAFE